MCPIYVPNIPTCMKSLPTTGGPHGLGYKLQNGYIVPRITPDHTKYVFDGFGIKLISIIPKTNF